MTTDGLFLIICLLALIDVSFIICLGVQHGINRRARREADLNAAVIAAVLHDLEDLQNRAGLTSSRVRWALEDHTEKHGL